MRWGTLLNEVTVLRRLLFAAFFLTLCLSAHDLYFSIAKAHPHPAVKGTLEFRLIEQLPQEPWYSVIAGARILVIGPDGTLLKTGVTNESGEWIAEVTVPADQRFSPSRTLGTVTALAVANGYIERIFFDVPVTEEGAVQVVTLSPIKPHQRNEPGYELGMLHRLWVLPLLDRYAEQAGLGKQPPVEGDWNSPHWSPEVTPP
jgi:hypothetical protein